MHWGHLGHVTQILRTNNIPPSHRGSTCILVSISPVVFRGDIIWKSWQTTEPVQPISSSVAFGSGELKMWIFVRIATMRLVVPMENWYRLWTVMIRQFDYKDQGLLLGLSFGGVCIDLSIKWVGISAVFSCALQHQPKLMMVSFMLQCE